MAGCCAQAVAVPGISGRGRATRIVTDLPCPRCHDRATQVWQLRRVDRPVPGLWVQRVLSSRCHRGCLDEANPWILTQAFPSRPAYTAPPVTRTVYPDPAVGRRRLEDPEKID